MSRWFHSGIRAVFFDAVGTLLFPDPPAAAVYAAVARDQGLLVSEADVARRFVAAFRAEEVADREAGWRTSEAREEQRWRRIVGDSLPGLPDPEEGFRRLHAHFARPQAWRVHPEAAVVLSELVRRGVNPGMASNYDARLTSVADGLPELAPVRQQLVISSLVGFRKPAGEFFEAVEKAAGRPGGEILFVGDDPENDYLGATAAGFEAVLLDESWRYDQVPRRIRSLAELLS